MTGRRQRIFPPPPRTGLLGIGFQPPRPVSRAIRTADPRPAPGTINRVTPADIRETLCVRGYTHTIRPPGSYTGQEENELTSPGHRPSPSEWNSGTRE